MQTAPETTVDASGTPIRGAVGRGASPPLHDETPDATNALFDQAIIAWNQLRNGARIPEITALTHGVFLGDKAMHLVWKDHPKSQFATRVGSQIAQEFATEPGPISSSSTQHQGLPKVLRQIGEQAIRWGGPINLLEEIASAAGPVRSYRVLALPFALVEARETVVVMMFDWIEPARPPDDGGHLLFNQDLHADGTSTLNNQRKSSQPYFMVSMPGET